MRAFVDTTVLVAAFTADHVHHAPSRELFLTLARRQDGCAAHTLAELYSTLTRMPFPLRRDAHQAMLLISDLRARLTPVSLTADEYLEAIGDYAAMGIHGGAIYDGLIARCALKVRAQTIFTWNIRHFRQFGPDIEKRLRTP